MTDPHPSKHPTPANAAPPIPRSPAAAPHLGSPRSNTADPSRAKYDSYTRKRFGVLERRLAALARPDSVAPEDLRVAGPVDRITPADARSLSYEPAAVGDLFEGRWVTYWFRLAVRAPGDWAGSPVELAWHSHSEATVWSGDSPLGAFNPVGPDNPARQFLRLTEETSAAAAWDLHIEMACNDMFGLPRGGDTPLRQRFELDDCRLVRVDRDAWALYHDFRLLHLLVQQHDLPQLSKSFTTKAPLSRPGLEPAWAGRLLGELNRFANAFDPDNRDSWPPARAILTGLLAARNGSVAHDAAAIGHAHIDTAWLWPLEETTRKCVRTFSNVLGLMDRYPRLKFACSQAYQYTVMKQTQPELYERIRARAQEGRWIHVGGAWVEPDCNIPSGESLLRQALYGQHFFEREFGSRSRLFWAPDIFGYPAQLPQILRHTGFDRFLTQKLSWNAFNQPLHHTFVWRGLDGSEVLTHFPPADTYNARCTPEELRYHEANYKDADRSSDAIYLFGWGDGGGGPDDDMLEALDRLEDLQGMPRVTVRTPDELFDRLESLGPTLHTLSGELYFELHRGTLTTQARTKRLNRLAEHALAELELLAAHRTVTGDDPPSRADLERLWTTVCLHQFHDDLPGSSITPVYERTEQELAEVIGEANTLARRAPHVTDRTALLNTTSHARTDVVEASNGSLRLVASGPFALAQPAPEPAAPAAIVERDDGRLTLENEHVRATLAPTGEVVSLVCRATGRDLFEQAAGQSWRLYADTPTAWDAWDFDPPALETGRAVATTARVDVRSSGPLRAAVRFNRPLARHSTMTVTAELDAGARALRLHHHIDWRDRDLLLKLAARTNLTNTRATYDIQYGALSRPTTMNNRVEIAQFEVPAHRWADLSEPGAGLAILNDCKYGHAALHDELSVSLLRGTRDPDPDADLGEHSFTIALMPHAGDWAAARVVDEAAALNRPLLPLDTADAPDAPILAVAHDDSLRGRAVVDAVKPAEDSRDILLRLYESLGGAARVTITPGFRAEAARERNALEDDLGPLTLAPYGSLTLELKPFQLRTVSLTPGA